jgi:hypothetical protein
VREESVPIQQIRDLAIKVAALLKRAEQERVILPTDVALYIARNVRSNASALEGALIRLMAHSSVTGTEITLKYTQRVLANFIAAEARRVAVDPLQKLSLPLGTKEAKIERDGRRTSQVRHQLQVNMRESERQRLARWDAYERELERRAKKRKRA